MSFARAVFYIEAVLINLGVGLICFFFPGWFVRQIIEQAPGPLPLELTRWYGVLLFVLAYGMLRALATGSQTAVTVMVEALLVGDLAHLAASIFFFQAGGPVNVGTILMVSFSTFLAGVRAFWLIQTRKNSDG